MNLNFFFFNDVVTISVMEFPSLFFFLRHVLMKSAFYFPQFIRVIFFTLCNFHFDCSLTEHSHTL